MWQGLKGFSTFGIGDASYIPTSRVRAGNGPLQLVVNSGKKLWADILRPFIYRAYSLVAAGIY